MIYEISRNLRYRIVQAIDHNNSEISIITILRERYRFIKFEISSNLRYRIVIDIDDKNSRSRISIYVI